MKLKTRIKKKKNPRNIIPEVEELFMNEMTINHSDILKLIFYFAASAVVTGSIKLLAILWSKELILIVFL